LAGLHWTFPDDLDDEALERLLVPPAASAEARRARPRPNWAAVDNEIRRKGVTLALLWEEYRGPHPDGFGYSWLCEHYGAFKIRLRPPMQQLHAAAEKVFVGIAGDTIDVDYPSTGEVWPMKLFVAAMGASCYTFAQARPSEKIGDWIGAHVDLFAFSGGAPQFVVCDSLKAAVTNPDHYENDHFRVKKHAEDRRLPVLPYGSPDHKRVRSDAAAAQGLRLHRRLDRSRTEQQRARCFGLNMVNET
jgi:transposase